MPLHILFGEKWIVTIELDEKVEGIGEDEIVCHVNSIKNKDQYRYEKK